MSAVTLIRSTEVLIRDMPAHVVTEVSCQLIPGLRHSYDYMYSELPILSLGHELCPPSPPPPPPPPPRPIELTEAKRSFAKAVRYGTFFTYFFLILTPVNHLLEFQHSRYANYSLIMQKYQKQGLQELVVPVPLCSVPVPNRFWRVVLVPLWVVPVPFCHCISGTGTTPKGYRYQGAILPRNGEIHHFSFTFLP